MKRIGIITFYYQNYNYGGLLQAYALEYFLNHGLKDIYAEQICYNRNKIKLPVWDRALRFICRGNLKKKFSPKMPKRSIDSSNYSSFDRFENHIAHSVKIFDDNNYIEAQNDYDMFICGSDQIWNPIAIRKAYLLSGISKKKISYAASIAAGKLRLPELFRLKRGLSDFSAISVREDSAKKQIENLTDKRVVTVVDPVLLLTEDDWNDVACEPLVSESYIFTYFLGTVGESALEYARKNVQKHKKIVSVSGLEFGYSVKEEIAFHECGPREFLSLIKNADEVWTDSFHALVFSIIFERQFRVFSREGGVADMSERIRDILKMVRLPAAEQRDFKRAKQILNQKKEQSIEFLKKSIYD